jgi:hypothetical protein
MAREPSKGKIKEKSFHNVPTGFQAAASKFQKEGVFTRRARIPPTATK